MTQTQSKPEKTVLDLHVHSRFSMDSTVTPEKYAENLLALRKSLRIDGLAFCEHRVFNSGLDPRALGEKYGILVLVGVEVESRWGHVLVFSPDQNWLKSLDASRKPHTPELFEQAESHEGIAIPAHPYRGLISLGDRIRQLPNLHAIETINGANLPEENLKARMVAQELGLAEVGGSDAHTLDELGKGLTEFQVRINSIEQMIQELRSRRVKALFPGEARI